MAKAEDSSLERRSAKMAVPTGLNRLWNINGLGKKWDTDRSIRSLDFLNGLSHLGTQRVRKRRRPAGCHHGIMLSAVAFFQTLIRIVLNLFRIEVQSRRRWIVVMGVLALMVAGVGVWTSVRQGEGYFHAIFGVLAFGIGVVLVAQIISHAASARTPNGAQIIATVMMWVLAAGAFGQWLGYSVLEVARVTDVKTKSGELSGVKVVMVLSRHTILLKDKDIYVVRTDEILEFHS